ncbi:MAG: diacylglycerol kinase family protein [Adlercreutzia equolifaciens]
MKLLIVNNLASGFRDGAIYDFMRAFASDGDEICVRCTDGNTDLADFLRDAENFDAVVAAGGDGTVASVAYLWPRRASRCSLPRWHRESARHEPRLAGRAPRARPSHARAAPHGFRHREIELSNGERFDSP